MALSREASSTSNLSLQLFSEYCLQHGLRQLSEISLPAPINWPSVLERLGPHQCQALVEAWSAWASSRRHPQLASSCDSQILNLWDNKTLLSRALKSIHRQQPYQLLRFSWLRLLVYPLIPERLIQVMLRQTWNFLRLRTRQAKKESLIDLIPCIEYSNNYVSQPATKYYYVDPNLTDLAWNIAASTKLHGVPFPDRFQETDGLDAFIQLTKVRQVALQSPIRIKRTGQAYKKHGQQLCEQLEPWHCPIPDCQVHPRIWVALASLLGLLKVHYTSWTLYAAPCTSSLPASKLEACLKVWNAWLLYNLLDIYAPLSTPIDLGKLDHTALALQLFTCLYTAYILVQLPENAGISLRQLSSCVQTNEIYDVNLIQSDELARLIPVHTLSACLGIMWALGFLHWNEEHTLLRLAPLGRALFSQQPYSLDSLSQSNILVLPNLEIIAYRQALTPKDILDLSTIARWKTISPVATLEIDNSMVHQALQAGWQPSELLNWLEQRSSRPLPDTVRSLIGTSAQQQQRLTVYHRGTLLEFESAQHREAALCRGISGVKIGDRFLLIEPSHAIDYSHLRVTASLDYLRPTVSQIRVLSDGVTLEVPLNQANLLLEAELLQLAEQVYIDSVRQIARYRITPNSLQRARQQGWTALRLQEWFLLRCGTSAPDTVISLISLPHIELKVTHTYILETGSEAIANGLCQWPETAPYVARKLGPTTLAIHGHTLEKLIETLRSLGAKLSINTSISAPHLDGPAMSSS
ncbi:MAG: hypothetical protein RMI91_07750 [Gemmatales bacterium]|nr:helicase-associated domain-containing protein [Gemmatales bacterium]MDW7994533.1 hypothetical protein [Gemmatales bacterium]